jgi:hypothetical protein
MSSHREKSDEEPAAPPEVTALVPQDQFVRNRLAERQQAILEQLHRGLQAVSPAYPQLNVVWLQLRGNWSWLVVVPGEPGYSTADLARALCQTGTRLSVYPVEFLEAKDLDIDSSTRLIARLGIADGLDGDSPTAEQEGFASSSHARPITKTIVALESPLVNPLALPIALAAGGVVLCVRRGRDRLKSVRDTIQALGADRIRCCVLVD